MVGTGAWRNRLRRRLAVAAAVAVVVEDAARKCKRRRRLRGVGWGESNERDSEPLAQFEAEVGDADDAATVDVVVAAAVVAGGDAAGRRRRWKRVTLPSPGRPSPATWPGRKRRPRRRSRGDP